MDLAQATQLVTEAGWWEFDLVTGLRLDGDFNEDELEAFVWFLRNDQEGLEKLSRREK